MRYDEAKAALTKHGAFHRTSVTHGEVFKISVQGLVDIVKEIEQPPTVGEVDAVKLTLALVQTEGRYDSKQDRAEAIIRLLAK